MRTNVPPMVRGQLIGRVGDKRALVGLGVEHKLHEVFARIALDIKFDARVVGEKGGKLANIAAGSHDAHRGRGCTVMPFTPKPITRLLKSITLGKSRPP